MNLNPSYLIRHFKQRFGISPKAYHTQCRLREAVRLLRTTERPIKSIALDLGFPSAKAFQRIFKHHFGVRPLEVRTKTIFPREAASATPANPFQINRFNLRPPIRPNWMDRYRPPDIEYTQRGFVPPPR
jgi:AraC-like DNA-binding protein